MASATGTKAVRTLELSTSHCPYDVSEVADLYVLNRLTPEQAEIFEKHFLLCPECAEKAELAFEFSQAIKKYHL